MFTGAVVIWRREWGQKIHFQDGLVTWLASLCWLLAKGFRSSPSRCIHNAVWVLFEALPQGKQSKRARQKLQWLLWPTLAVIHVTSTILYWSYRDSFTGMKLCSHTGPYIQKSPALGLKLWCCHVDILNHFIFGLSKVKSIGTMEYTGEQRRYLQYVYSLLFLATPSHMAWAMHRILVGIQWNSKQGQRQRILEASSFQSVGRMCMY